MGTFGITDFNSSSALCKDGTIDKNNPSNPCINNGGVNWGGGFDWTKYGNIIPRATQTPVFCKDGTTDFTLSSPNAKYDNSKVCANNGGIDTEKTRQEAQKKIEEALKQQYEDAIAKANENSQAQKPRTFIEMNQGYIIIGLVLVAGYFAYKKYKK
jgi:hypothetical protein